jgi:PAS domain S-box-containing protein
MTKKMRVAPQSNSKALRMAAEERLIGNGAALSELTIDQLKQEYRVYAIELEMQNEALRQTQIELAKSRDLYIDLYDFSPVGYLTLSDKGQILDANLTVANLLGKERAWLHGQPLFRFVARDYKERWYAFLKSIKQMGRREVQEIQVERSDGYRFFVRLDCMYVLRPDSDPCIRVAVTNIGELSSIERSARESKSRYRALYESMRDAFVLVDISGKLLLSNRPYQEMLGYSEKELKQKNYIDLTPEKWHSFEAQVVEEQVLPWGESVVYEKEYIRKDGTVFPIELKTVLLKNENDQIEGMWAVVRDISARKRAEAELGERESRFRMAMQAISGVVYDWNMATDAIFFTERFVQLLGTQFPDGVPVQQWWHDHVHPDDYELLKTEVRHAMKTPTGRYETVYRMRHGDGHWLHIVDRGFVLCDGEGRAIRMVGSLTDISARIRAETALRTLNDSLEEKVAQRSVELSTQADALRESELFIRSTLDAISSAVAVADETGKIVFKNKVWSDIEGEGRPDAGQESTRDCAAYLPCLRQCSRNAEQCVAQHKIDSAIKSMLTGKRQSFSLEYTCSQILEPRWLSVRIDNFKGSALQRLVIVHEDITERKIAANELARVATNFKKMLRKVELAHEEHSKQLAREVHDQLGATLTMLKLGLATSKSTADLPLSLQGKFDGMIELADMAVQSVKRVTAKLRPSMLDTLGLVAALKWHAKEFSRMTGIATEVQIPDYIKLSPERGNAVFRIIQESLTNVAKHAHASKVTILGLKAKRELIFIVNDDGIGLPKQNTPQRNSFGVIGMQERASYLGGRLLLDNLPEGGASMSLHVPLEMKEREQEEDLFS